LSAVNAEFRGLADQVLTLRQWFLRHPHHQHR
jgi:hypothetical protein